MRIRHGEPDYSPCTARGFVGHGRYLAPLTPAGMAQARIAADSPLLCGCEFIASSPYTRALQAAAIISRRRGLDVRVEVELHEWMPDLALRYAPCAGPVALHD